MREGLIGWAILLGVCVALILWGLLNYTVIKDRVRTWDFGALPDLPSQSVYSSATPPKGRHPPRQIAPLPEAQPATTRSGEQQP